MKKIIAPIVLSCLSLPAVAGASGSSPEALPPSSAPSSPVLPPALSAVVLPLDLPPAVEAGAVSPTVVENWHKSTSKWPLRLRYSFAFKPSHNLDTYSGLRDLTDAIKCHG